MSPGFQRSIQRSAIMDVPTLGTTCAKKFIIIILISVYTTLKVYRVSVYIMGKSQICTCKKKEQKPRLKIEHKYIVHITKNYKLIFRGKLFEYNNITIQYIYILFI